MSGPQFPHGDVKHSLPLIEAKPTSCFYLLILSTNANICSLKSTPLAHNRWPKITLMLAALTQNQQGHTFKALKPDFTVVAFKRIKIVISVSQIYRLPFSKHSAVVSQLWDVLCSYKLSFFLFSHRPIRRLFFLSFYPFCPLLFFTLLFLALL